MMPIKNKKILAIRYAALSAADKSLVRAELSEKELAALDLLVAELEDAVTDGRSVGADFYRTILVDLGKPLVAELSGWDKFVAAGELSPKKIPANLLNIINEVVGVDKSEYFYER